MSVPRELEGQDDAGWVRVAQLAELGVLTASLLHELRPVRALSKLRGQPIPLKLIADFLGVLHGRALRIVHELADDLRTSI